MIDILGFMRAGLALFFLAGADARPCPSTTVAVNVTSTADVQSLADALNCTGEGTFDITWYAGVTNAQKIDVSNKKNVTVTGNGFPRIRGTLPDDHAADTIVDAGEGGRLGLFSVSNGSTLRLNNLVLEGGNAEDGGAVDLFRSSSLLVFGCTFVNNNASRGGAIFASTSTIYIAGNTSFDGNSAAENGGAIFVQDNSSVQVEGRLYFVNNSAGLDGGALFAATDSSIDFDGDIVFDGNSAAVDGGGILLFNGSFIKTGGTTSFLNNVADGDGGAIFMYEQSSMQIDGGIDFVNNSAGVDGGAAYLLYGSSMHTNGGTSFLNNSAGFDGGAILFDGSSIQIDGGASFLNNIAKNDGGAVYLLDGSSMHTNGGTSFLNNSAGYDAGAILLFDGSSIQIDGGASFLNNIAKNDGGAIVLWRDSSIEVDGSISCANNSARRDGGAILLYDNSSIHVDGDMSAFNNSARKDGGALFAGMYSLVDLDGDIVFGGNYAGRDGGAIFLFIYTSMQTDGGTSFLNNFAERDGGAVCGVEKTVINIDGNASFGNNFVNNDGGAIYTVDSSFVDIDGNSIFDNNFAKHEGGAIFAWLDVSLNFTGDASFFNNVAKARGGALQAFDGSSIVIEGDSNFDNNLAGIDGGAVHMRENTTMQIVGRTSFMNNYAGGDGGAILASASSIHIDGDNNMYNNSAINSGGAIHIREVSVLTIEGNTFGHNNSAGTSGGVIHASKSSIHMDGSTSVASNSANSPGGGFLFATQTDVNIDGSTYVAHNSGYDGGAVLSQESDIHITGNATFGYNKANRDGGAIKTTDTSLTIGTTTKGAGFSPTSALPGGFMETLTFVKNSAFDFGGAIAISSPLKLNVSDVNFESNKAEAGGAISVASADWAAAEFQRCRFERNRGTRGGALYFNGEGKTWLQDSSLRLNVAEETGGALFNIGALEIVNTVFAENTATIGGLAINNLASTSTTLVLWNVTFDGNILGCPAETYSFTQDASDDNCRFELACAQCMDGCNSDLSNVRIDTETLPICEPIPLGVKSSQTATTLQRFDLEKGYFRTSADSPNVLECYQPDACVGGIDPSGYCDIGYTGPYCAVCSEDYAPGSSSRCHECSGKNGRFAVGFSVTVVILVLVVALLVIVYLVQIVRDGGHQPQNQRQRWWKEKLALFRSFVAKAVPLSAIKIVVVVLQIVIQFTEIAGEVYPEEYESFLSSLSFVNFDFSFFVSSSCIFTPDFFDRLVLATVVPLALGFAGAVTFCIAKIRNRGSSTAGPIVKHKHLSIVLFMVFFVYSSVSFVIFQTFVCDSLDDGKAYLRADYSITCFTEKHKAYRIYASLMVFVYPVGIPAFFAFWLVRHRHQLQKSDRETVQDLKAYRYIWRTYKPSCYYYEVVECGRRIVLTAAAVFVLPDTAEQVAIVLFLAVIFVFVSESMSPFKSDTDMRIYRWGNGIILASMYVALLLRVDLAEEGSQSSSTITVVLIAANVFMIFTVAVQSMLLMKGVCASRVQDNPSNRSDDDEGFAIEEEAAMGT